MSRLKTLAFAVLPTIFMLAAAELVVRLSGAAERCPMFKDSPLWACDPILNFKTRPDFMFHGKPLNKAGFRSREFGKKPPGVYRILSLGDSCTFGITTPGAGLYVDEPYPQQLEALVAKDIGPGKVQVLNAGVPGYNSYQGLLLMRSKLRGLAPDLVTVRFGWNDHLMSGEAGVAGAFHETRNGFLQDVQGLLLRTALYPFSQRLGMEIATRLNSARRAPALPTKWIPNVSLEDYEHNLRRIAEIARGQGAQVWFLTAPEAFLSEQLLRQYEALPRDANARKLLFLSGIPSFRRAMEIHDAYNAVVRRLGVELGVPVIDMDRVYREHASEGLFSMEDALHPTPAGYNLEARTLYERLILEGIIPGTAGTPTHLQR